VDEAITEGAGMTIGERFPTLLDAARQGDRGSLEALYHDLAPVVIGYLRGQGAAEPDDLAAEVFVGVARGLGSFRGDERAFRSWVFSIAHRRLIDERRRLSRRKERAVDPADLAEGLDRPGGDVEAEALDRIGESWVLRAIRRLTPEQRAVLLLRVVADLPVEEVARIVGRSPGAVKALQRRALSSLARQIDREGVS
jgi:RNA polymerase sigma factor (sigma-70 family)